MYFHSGNKIKVKTDSQKCNHCPPILFAQNTLNATNHQPSHALKSVRLKKKINKNLFSIIFRFLIILKLIYFPGFFVNSNKSTIGEYELFYYHQHGT